MDIYTKLQITNQKYQKLLWFNGKEGPRVPYTQLSLYS